MPEAAHSEKNVLGGPLLACSYAPLTGYFRDGCCATHGEAGVAHLVCVKVTERFLQFSLERGNDLTVSTSIGRLFDSSAYEVLDNGFPATVVIRLWVYRRDENEPVASRFACRIAAFRWKRMVWGRVPL